MISFCVSYEGSNYEILEAKLKTCPVKGFETQEA